MTGRILVTGATGGVGGEVVRQLTEWHGLGAQEVVAAVRRPEDWRPPEGEEVGVVRFDFQDPATWPDAFTDVDRMFLVRPPAISDVKQWVNPALEVARKAGVRHVVFLSLMGVDRNKVVPHRAIEDYLRESGLDWTFLRAGFFMQNLSTTHRDEIRERGEILVPAGKGRTSFIDTRDIAAVAARVLTESGHEGEAYELSGDEALTYGEVAEILSDQLRREVVYRRPGLLEFIRENRRQGHPLPFVLVMAGIYTTARLGLAGRTTDHVRRLLGRPPTTLRQFVRDHRACWEQAQNPVPKRT